MTTMAVNAARAAAAVAAAKATGKQVIVPDGVRDARLAVCRECPHYRSDDQRCSLCGCSLRGAIFNKAAIAQMRCPDNPPRWGAWDPGLDSKSDAQ